MKVAAIQAAPIFLDTAATLEKVLSLMEEAAGAGARLCVFPETFLPGYPVWVFTDTGAKFNDSEKKAAYAAYVGSSIEADGPELAAVASRAAKLGLFTYLGIVERAASGASVYCSLAAIHPERGVVGIHRKLMPTDAERMIWSQGDGNGLRVHEFDGVRFSGLNCWENWMPLARYSLYAQGEQVHVATWPGAPYLTKDITRFIAMEGRVYSIAAGGVLRAKDIPDSFPLKAKLAEQGDRYLSGGTMIVAPDGSVLEGPAKDEETILYADLDMGVVAAERQNFDPSGHYGRPDVFDLRVDRRRRIPIKTIEEE